MTFQPVYQCGQCGAKVKPDQDVCTYCGYYLRQTQEKTSLDTVERLVESNPIESEIWNPTNQATEIIVAFILSMIALLIAVNLIGPISKVVIP